MNTKRKLYTVIRRIEERYEVDVPTDEKLTKKQIGALAESPYEVKILSEMVYPALVRSMEEIADLANGLEAIRAGRVRPLAKIREKLMLEARARKTK